jgi:hypothetical protein
MVVTLENTADWAATNGRRSPIKPEFLDDYVEYVTAVVERYDGDGIDDAPNGAVVNYWEFYNEPDFDTAFGEDGWGRFGAQYAEMLEAVYEPIHDANPNAKVVFGGIAYNLFSNEGSGGLFARRFLQDVLDAGGGEFFDVMNFHYYPFEHNRTVWTETNASGLREKYADIKGKLEAAGVGDKPIMITELAWHSDSTNPDYPSTPTYQARRVLELMTQAAALEPVLAIWWPFTDSPGAFRYSTGLVKVDDDENVELKPSYFVYVEAVKRLGEAEFDANFILPSETNDLEAYRFRDGITGDPFYVAWLNPVAPFHKDDVPTFDDSTTQNLQVDGEVADIITKEGDLRETLRDADDGADDGKITVVVGRNPIYIVIK